MSLINNSVLLIEGLQLPCSQHPRTEISTAERFRRNRLTDAERVVLQTRSQVRTRPLPDSLITRKAPPIKNKVFVLWEEPHPRQHVENMQNETQNVPQLHLIENETWSIINMP